MEKRILILNGATRRSGNTAGLIRAFADGARRAGHTADEFYLHDMYIHGCTGCLKARRDPSSPCTVKDDMQEIYPVFAECDVVVFASPVYFWTISGPLKTAADRLYAELECLGYPGFARECVLLMTADGADYSKARDWYRNYERNLGWKNRGEVLGKHKTGAAFALGTSL